MTRNEEAIGSVRIVPADAATRDDLEVVFGGRGDPPGCRCQWFKLSATAFDAASREELAAAQARQVHGTGPGATTSGLIAYVDDEPAAWCAVEPRTAYPRLASMPTPWAGRDEDREDDSVWAITCFVTRVGFRRRGLGSALASAAVQHARDHGARAVEGYPRLGQPAAAALYVGTPTMFERAGLVEVSRPSAARAVIRLDF